jgi:hypothetical protein
MKRNNSTAWGLVLLTFGLMFFFLVATSGCSITGQKHNIVSATSTTIGFVINKSADQSPQIKIGYNRERVTVVPTVRGTNEWIHTPDVVDSISAENNKQGQSLNEDFATGEKGVASISTNSVGQRAIAHRTKTNSPAVK